MSDSVTTDPAKIGPADTATRRVASRSWRAKKLRAKARRAASAMRMWEIDGRRLTDLAADAEVPASLVSVEGLELTSGNLSCT